MATFPQPPNRTNLTAIYGPIYGLFNAAQNQKVLIETEDTDTLVDHELNGSKSSPHSQKFLFAETSSVHRVETCKSIAALALLKKLRWSTLGLQFDWSKVHRLSVTFYNCFFNLVISLVVALGPVWFGDNKHWDKFSYSWNSLLFRNSQE